MKPFVRFLVVVLFLATITGCSRQVKIEKKLPGVLELMESDMKEGHLSTGRQVLDPWVDDLGRREVVAELMKMAKTNNPYPHALLWMIKAYGSDEEFLEASKLLPDVDIKKLPPVTAQ